MPAIPPAVGMWLNIIGVAASAITAQAGVLPPTVAPWVTLGSFILNGILHGASSTQPGPLIGGK